MPSQPRLWTGYGAIDVIGLSADDQLGKAQFERLIKQFRVIPFPLWHGTVQGIENAADLLRSRGGKAASVLAVELLDLRAGDLQVGDTATGVEPKFPAFGRVTRRLNLDWGVSRGSVCERVLTVGLCQCAVRPLAAIGRWRELLPNLFVCYVHATSHELLEAY